MRRAQPNGETTYKQKFLRCQENGHNKQTCRNQPVRHEQDSSSKLKN